MEVEDFKLIKLKNTGIRKLITEIYTTKRTIAYNLSSNREIISKLAQV